MCRPAPWTDGGDRNGTCRVLLAWRAGHADGTCDPPRGLAPRDARQGLPTSRHVTNILPEMGAGRTPARCRGDHAGRAHSSAIRRTSTTTTICRSSACSRRPTTIASTRRRASRSSASIPMTARSTRRWRSRTATSCWCRAAITRCAAMHGYDLYYLNVMAGPKRVWKFYNEPAHEWLLKA